MGANGNYDGIESFVSWKRQQGSNLRCPPRANFLAAAAHIRNLLDGKKFNWAAIGGLAMLCLGSQREMFDIHIVYDDRDFQRIKAKLEADQRVTLPKSMNPLFPSKLLVRTGPELSDAGCSQTIDVELDLVPPGSNGSPPNDILRKNQVLLRLNLKGKLTSFKGLNMLYLVKTTLAYCKNQDLAWDPKQDLVFMCLQYGQVIEAIRNRLDPKELNDLFFSTLFYSQLTPQEQKICSVVLSGKEILKPPPPRMAITPPPNTRSNVALNPDGVSSVEARHGLQSYKSTPHLGSSKSPSSAFLSPPLAGKPKSSPRPTPHIANTVPAQVQSPPNAPTSQAVAIHTTRGESRSQYRHMSAPNTPGHLRNSSLNPAVASTAHERAKSLDFRPLTQQVTNAPPVQSTRKPHMNFGNAPPLAALGNLPQKSMPDLRGVANNRGLVPVFGLHGTATGLSTMAQDPSRSSIKAPGLDPVYKGQRVSAHIASPSAGVNQLSQSRKQHRYDASHLRSSSDSTIAPTSSYTIHSEFLRTHDLHAPLQNPIQPPNDPNSTVRPNHSPITAHGSVSPPGLSNQRMFPVELPATAHLPTATDISPPQLPHVPTKEPLSDIPQPNAAKQSFIDRPGHQSMAIELPADSTPQPRLGSQTPTRQTDATTPSEPIIDLPASLIAGGPSGRKRSPHNSISHPSTPPQPQLHPLAPQANAGRYTRYPPDTIAPATAQSSQYIAYPGPISPPLSAPTTPANPPFEAPIYKAPTTHQPLPHILRVGPNTSPRTNPLSAHPPTPPASDPAYTTYKYSPPFPLQPHPHYEHGAEPRLLPAPKLSPPASTGYEEFTHGPYTPVLSNNDYAAPLLFARDNGTE